jgi:hypothetical protein
MLGLKVTGVVRLPSLLLAERRRWCKASVGEETMAARKICVRRFVALSCLLYQSLALALYAART